MNRSVRLNRRLLLQVFLAAAFIATLLFALQVANSLPDRSDLREIRHQTSSRILSADGETIGTFSLENRTQIPLRQISPELTAAVIAIEDIRFRDHGGIDYRALARVFVRSLLLQQNAGGGSTLSQQLVKNLFPRKSSGPAGLAVDKLREMMTARRLEQLYSKDEILELYLNTVSFGEDTFGIEAASRRFYNKTASDLTIGEAATLAGLLRAPGALNPRLYPDRARERRNVVLSRMIDAGMITADEADPVRTEPIELNYHRQTASHNPAPHFREYVRRELETLLQTTPALDGDTYNLHTDGLIIQTTIDARLQRIASEALTSHLRDLRSALPEQAPDSLLNGGFLAVEPATGHIRAWVGSESYSSVQFDHVLSRRQTGSAFKPLIYASAIEQGLEPCDYRRNRLSRYEAWDEWTPRNVSDEYGGHWSLQGALAHSVNTVAVELLMETGLEPARQTARRFGISGVPSRPSIALGAAESSLWEMVPAYAAIAASGRRVEPVWIKAIHDSQGRQLYSFDNRAPSGAGQAVSPETAAALLAMLSKSVDEGTGRPLRDIYGISGPVAGKTGTTQQFTDGWFLGLTPDLAFGVWVGGSNRTFQFPPHTGFASRTALPVAGRFLAEATDPSGPTPLPDRFHPHQHTDRFSFACSDHRDDSTLDRLRNFFTGERADEPRVVEDSESQEARGFRDRVRSLFGRD